MQKLYEQDRQKIMDYITKAPYVNLFIIGDLMEDGFNDEIQSFYGRYENEELVNIMMRYRDCSLHLYADELNAQDLSCIENLIKTENITGFNFGEKTAPKIKNWLAKNKWDLEECYLSVYTPNSRSAENFQTQPTVTAIKATAADAAGIIDVISNAFPDSTEKVETVASDIARDARITYIIKEGAETVCVASAVAFTDDAAMVIGVGTKESAREKGYATICVQALCEDLYQNNRRAVLFYFNQKAGSIYHKLGFIDQEKYWMGANKIKITTEQTADYETLYTFVEEVFKTAEVSDGTEQDYMVTLRNSANYIPELALVAKQADEIVGHIMLTEVSFESAADNDINKLLLLAPLSIAKTHRNQGIGQKLIKTALAKATAMGYDAIVLLGHKKYYEKFGFQSANKFAVTTDLEIPVEHIDNFMICDLSGKITEATNIKVILH